MADHKNRQGEQMRDLSSQAQGNAKRTRIEDISVFGEGLSDAEMRLVSRGGAAGGTFTGNDILPDVDPVRINLTYGMIRS